MGKCIVLVNGKPCGKKANFRPNVEKKDDTEDDIEDDIEEVKVRNKFQYCEEHKSPNMIRKGTHRGDTSKKCTFIDDNKQRCTKHASYGYKNGPKEYCKNHAEKDMICLSGYICANGTCIKGAAFRAPNDDKLYCKMCAPKNAVNVLNKKCKSCDKQPRYNFSTEKRPIFCVTHKSENMVDVTKTTCLEEGCQTIPTYGEPGSKKKQYCTKHKKIGMVDVTTKPRCLDCTKVACFNYIGQKKGIYCNDHKKETMINLYFRKCKHSGCIVTASYGFQNGKLEYCATHKLDNMKTFSSQKCKECDKCPSYGLPTDKTATYCQDHALEGMVNIKHKLCDKCNKKIATFNFSGQRPLRCRADADIGMIDVTAIRCDECTITAGFNYPGLQQIKCSLHKKAGMIAEPRKKCNSCKEPAIYGKKVQIHCELHKEDGEYNLVEKKCSSCGLTTFVNEKQLCGYCDPTMMKKHDTIKQNDIKLLLDTKKYKYSSYDRIIDANCGKERPDFLFDCNSYFVVLEIDEFAHRNQSKGNQCEITRMINVSQTLGTKTIFIRYNPDSFKVANCRNEISNIKRYSQLCSCLDEMLNKKYEELEFLSVVYLFYDDYKENDFTLTPIQIFKNDTPTNYNSSDIPYSSSTHIIDNNTLIENYRPIRDPQFIQSLMNFNNDLQKQLQKTEDLYKRLFIQ